MFDMNLVYWRI